MDGKNNNRRRPYKPRKMWSEETRMLFGNAPVDVGEVVKSRSPEFVKEFVTTRTDLSDSRSFSRIIAFDTECSVNYADHCEMCSFGYAEFDLDGNEISREEIYIKARPAKGRLKEKCQADPEMYVNAPDWREQYPKIKEILTRKDTISIAHSCKSDIGFLMLMNKNRRTNQFYFRVFDTLEIFQKALPGKEKYNLPFLAESLGIEHDAHVSLSDAIVCFKVLQKVAEINNMSVKEMLQTYQDTAMFDSVDVLRDNVRFEIRHQIDAIKENSNRSRSEGRLSGQRFASTKKMEKADPEAMLALARYVVINGGQYVSSIANATVFVWDGDTDSGDYEFAKRQLPKNRNFRILRIDEVLDGRFGKLPEVCENLRNLLV